MSNDFIQPQNSEIVMYQTEDGFTKIDMQMSDETVCLSLEQMEKHIEWIIIIWMLLFPSDTE